MKPILIWSPQGDNLFVRPLLPPDQTSGGLILPEDAQKHPHMGVVVAVGPGVRGELTRELQPVTTQRGDLVLFGQYAGQTPQNLDGQNLLILRDPEVLASKPVGTYALVEHETPGGETVAHIAEQRCQKCPPDQKELDAAANLTAERERLQAERQAREGVPL